MNTAHMYNKLLQHSECGEIEIANYANGENLAVECVVCSEVILDFDKPHMKIPKTVKIEFKDNIELESYGHLLNKDWYLQ